MTLLLLLLLLLGIQSGLSVNFTILSEPSTTWNLVLGAGQGSSVPSCSTETSTGGCDLAVKENSLFEVHASSTSRSSSMRQKESTSFQDLLLFGYFQEQGEPGNYTTYTGTRNQLHAVLKLLDLSPDPSKGTVVVGLDISNDGSNSPHSLDPAVGASVKDLSAASSPGIIYEGVKPTFGSAIVEGGSSFVTFANVEVGAFYVEISPPEGMECALGPAGVDSGAAKFNYASASTQADKVSVVAFICA